MGMVTGMLIESLFFVVRVIAVGTRAICGCLVSMRMVVMMLVIHICKISLFPEIKQPFPQITQIKYMLISQK